MNVFDLDEDFLKDIDYVFHLAFVTNIPNSISNPVDTTKDNIDMTVHLLDKCTKAKVKILFLQLDLYTEIIRYLGMKK